MSGPRTNRRKVCGPTLALSLGVERGANWGARAEQALSLARLDAAMLRPSSTPVNVALLRTAMNYATGRTRDVYGSETLLLVCVRDVGFCYLPDLRRHTTNQCYAEVYAGLPPELFELAVSRGFIKGGTAREIAKARRELCVEDVR